MQRQCGPCADGGLMNQKVIVRLVIVLTVGFILAKLVGGNLTLKP